MASPVEPSGTEARRPRVVVLGGGFAGIGAARTLKEADADVVLVDEHDYHTFQPLLYQLATDLLATRWSDTRCGISSTSSRTSPSTRTR